VISPSPLCLSEKKKRRKRERRSELEEVNGGSKLDSVEPGGPRSVFDAVRTHGAVLL
jgi:hypothetical protein